MITSNNESVSDIFKSFDFAMDESEQDEVELYYLLLNNPDKTFGMSNIVQYLQSEVDDLIKVSTEVYVAVALASDYSLDVLSRAQPKAKVKVVVGIDLPTPVNVLKELRSRYSANARVYRSEFFHPKVYLFRKKDNSFVGFIGSGNFTNGGFHDNIELSYKVTEAKDCKELLIWFNGIFSQSMTITNSFLSEYKEYCDNWSRFKKHQKGILEEINEHEAVFDSERQALKAKLIQLRNSSDYDEICRKRAYVVEDIRKSLDYYHDFKKIDLDAFLGIGELGHILRFYQRTQAKNIANGKMKHLFSVLCDESIPLIERFRYANEEGKLNGCANNVLTKVLVVHNPKKYLLWNTVLDTYMKRYGFVFERGTKPWEKYVMLCDYFAELCKEVGIKDFAVLDELLYRAMEE